MNMLESLKGSDYDRSFAVRGHSYDMAMQLYPHVRHREFAQLFESVDWQAINHVLDIPSGGAYLQRHLPAHCQLDSIDPCQNFRAKAAGGSLILDTMNLPRKRYDLIVSLAALHHIENKQTVIDGLFDVLSDDGCLQVADVMAGSVQAQFLDEFAGRYNVTGHQGAYLSRQSFVDFCEARNDIELISNESRNCFWVFADEWAMVDFCKQLFGLVGVDDKLLRAELDRYIGFYYANGKVYLQWQLLYVNCRKQSL